MQAEKRNLVAMVLPAVVALAGAWPTVSPAQPGNFRGPIHGVRVEGELGQNGFASADRKTVQRLAKARELLAQARYDEAVDYLRYILDLPEDSRFQPDLDVPIYRSIKVEAGRLIGSMPPKGRETYRLNCGADARRLLEGAVSSGDMAGLEECSRRFFHTEAGYEATLLLGLNHFDRARPLAGALTLQRLRDVAWQAGRFEPTFSLALASCWLQVGEQKKAEEVLSGLKRQLGGRTVAIGGRPVPWFGEQQGALVWLAGMIGPQLPARPAESADWVMCRGNPARNAAFAPPEGDSAGGMPLLNMLWEIPTDCFAPRLDVEQLQNVRRTYLEQGAVTLPALQPLAVDGMVLMRTASNLVGVDFATGRRKWIPANSDGADPMLLEGSSNANVRTSLPPTDLANRMCYDAVYGSLSSDGRYVFAVEDLPISLSAPTSTTRIVNGQRIRISIEPQNRLIACEIRKGQGKLAWNLGGSPEEDSADGLPPLPLAGTFFLGPPLPLMGRLYVLAEIDTEIRLLELDAQTGKLRWQQKLVEVDRNILERSELRRRLAGASPSYAGGILICPTSTGTVVAVDLLTHSLLWQFGGRSPLAASNVDNRARALIRARQVRMTSTALRQPMGGWCDSTASVVDGRVLVAPVGSAWLYCLNLTDGKLLWKYQRQDDLYVGCVHHDKVVLVGRSQVRAVSLSQTAQGTEKAETTEVVDGNVRATSKEVPITVPKPAWDGRTVALPEESMPSGRGFLAGGRYYVPLTSAEVIAIDVDTGKVVERSKSQEGHVPGNLICYRGHIISQGFDGVKVFRQLGTVRKEADRRLAEKPDDPVGLADRAELLMNEGKQVEAIESLCRAYELGAVPRTRALLRDALLKGLASEFATYGPRADEIEKLLDGTGQRATFLRQMATGLRATGEWREAFDYYFKLLDLNEDYRRLERVSTSHSVRRDRWIRAEVAALQAEVKDAATVGRLIAPRLEAAIEQDELDVLRRFLDCFGNQPAAAEARLELVRRLKEKESAKLLEAELALWPQRQSSDRAIAAAATAELAELLLKCKRVEDAAWCYRRLGGEFADVVCRRGKTGKELYDALPGDEALEQLLGRDATWPVGLVEAGDLEPVSSTGHGSYGPLAMPYRGDPGPFLGETVLELNRNRIDLQSRNALGRAGWQAKLVEPGMSSQLGYQVGLAHARGLGHLLVLSIGNRVLAVDTLGTAQIGTPKLLWSHDVSSSALNVTSHGEFRIVGGRVVSRYGGSSTSGANSLGPITPGCVVFRQHQKLIGADPLTGSAVWVQHRIPVNSVLFGDEQFVFVLTPGAEEASVFRTPDGHLLGKRKIPKAQPSKLPVATAPSLSRYARPPSMPGGLAVSGREMLGRHVLLWKTSDDGCQLELFDPWQQRPVWPSRKFAAGAKTYLVGSEAVGVFEPEGHFVLLGLPDGRVIVDAQLQPQTTATDICVLRSGDQYVLVVNGKSRKPSSGSQPFQSSYRPPHKVIGHGLVYSFDLQGKPMWPEPVEIENQCLTLNQPGRLPVLAFVSSRPTRTITGSTRHQIVVEFIDKRTGRKVHEQKCPTPIARFELAGDPEEDTVAMRVGNFSVTLKFTGKPIPPPAEDKSGKMSRIGTSLLRVLGKGAAEALSKSGDSTDDEQDRDEPPVADPFAEPPALPPAAPPRR